MLPVAVDPKVLDPKAFLEDVLTERLVNVNIPDTPQRIATDTSQKVSVRFGNAIKAHIEKGDVERLEYIPFALAAWFRYLVGVDDSGSAFELSPDPCMTELSEVFSGLEFGISLSEALEKTEKLLPIYIGCDILNTGITEKTAEYFYKMMGGVGAVRKTLAELINR